MNGSLKELVTSLPAKLSRRIAFWVFFSVIVIEFIIFIPSLHNREQELLDQIREISTAKVGVTMQVVDKEIPDDMYFKKVRMLLAHPLVVGLALYRKDGTSVGLLGEPPELGFEDVAGSQSVEYYNRKDDRFEISYMGGWQRSDNILIIRHDATSLKKERLAFILRISGLVVIISIFVTLGALAALGPIVVLPILRLRKDLVAAGDAVSRDAEPPEFLSEANERQDELGDVIGAFRKMFRQISDAITRRKSAEAALKESLNQVETISKTLNNELEKGREMQKNFLPRDLIQPMGWEVAAYFKPARQVAGDYYDIFELPEGQIGIVVADVCDKGVGAALFMALFRSLIRIFSGQFELCGGACPGGQAGGHTLEEITIDAVARPQHQRALEAIVHTNNYVARNHGDLGMFATLFFGILDPETGEVAYINAGHDPLFLLRRDGGIRDQLLPTGPAVGVVPDAEFAFGSVRVTVGETLVGYTDGVPEAVSPEGDFFEMRRLTDLLRSPMPSADALIQTIAERVLAHTGDGEQFDDITILGLRRTGKA
ncbi:MAG: PP2C family protein-serine/threonine phosphatase [Desulfobacterales bacterium]|jgi:serine phosphatase RsbU (regulator of sigma subunit)